MRTFSVLKMRVCVLKSHDKILWKELNDIAYTHCICHIHTLFRQGTLLLLQFRKYFIH